jgi:WD40 repeat protein/uncharacterized caspase-like protein
MNYSRMMYLEWFFCAFLYFLLSFAVTTSARSEDLPQSQSDNYNSDRIAEIAYETVVQIYRRHGREQIVYQANNVIAGCIDWTKFRAARGSYYFYINRLWPDLTGQNRDDRRAAVVNSCREWRATEQQSCQCQLIVEDGRPALRVLNSPQQSLSLSPIREIYPFAQSSNTVRATPSLVLQSGHDFARPDRMTSGVTQFSINYAGFAIAASSSGNERRVNYSNASVPSSASNVVITHAEGTIIAWDRLTGRQIRSFEKVFNIAKFALSFDGNILLTKETTSFSRVGKAMLWSLESGRVLHDFGDAGDAIAVSPHGNYLFISDSGGREQVGAQVSRLHMGRVINSATGEILWQIETSGPFTGAEFSEDGNFLLTREWATATLWSINDRSIVFRRVFPGLEGATFSPDDSNILVYGTRNTSDNLRPGFLVRLNRNGNILNDIDFPNAVKAVQYAPFGEGIFVNVQETSGYILNAINLNLATVFVGARGPTIAAAFFPQGKKIVTISSGGPLQVWDTASGVLQTEIELPAGSDVKHLAISLDGSQILAIGSTVSIVGISNGVTLRQLTRGVDSINIDRAFFSDDESRILFGAGGNYTSWLIRGNGQLRSAPAAEWIPQSLRNQSDFRISADGRIYSLTEEKFVGQIPSHSKVVSWMSSLNMKHIISHHSDGTIQRWAVAGEIPGQNFRPEIEAGLTRSGSNKLLSVSDDGRYVAVSDGRTIEIRNHAGEIVSRIRGGSSSCDIARISSLTLSPDGRHVAIGMTNGFAAMFDTHTGRCLSEVDHGVQALLGDDVPLIAFLSNEIVLSISENGISHVWSYRGRKLFSPSHQPTDLILISIPNGTGGMMIGRINDFSLANHGKNLITVGTDGFARIWDLSTGLETEAYFHGNAIRSARASPDNRLLLTAGRDGLIMIWNLGGNQTNSFVNLIPGPDLKWIVASHKGFFDASNLEHITGFSWVMPDAPFRPLLPEIFMRDYYEPRLLPRLLACSGREATDPGACERAFRPIRPLASLNRVQPEVRILGVRRDQSSANFALVDVEVSGREDTSQPNGKTTTAAYDLRLFRNGQLVAQWPDPTGNASGSDGIETWRRNALVLGTEGAASLVRTFRVRLPARDRGQPVAFTAYAFNEDRVKSETAAPRDPYLVPQDVAHRKPRAYVVAVGVDAYDNPSRNLSFAASDARAVVGALRGLDGYRVVTVPLVSELSGNPQATKENIRAVLDLLAGRGEAERPRLRTLLGSEVDELAQATPDDLVVFTFSGHGYADQLGKFYLLPADSGTGNEITADTLRRFISSDEIEGWLRDVDAGELVMVIDACHSAASVEAGGFRPGPMGDRGFGQLAYDRGMRILAATQAENVAVESGRIGHGLLTYALVRDGLEQRRADADGDGAVTLAEWLRYGEARVPALYEEIRAGTLRLAAMRGVTPDAALVANTVRYVQTPALFDFRRGGHRVVVKP